ncbi:MAG: hypothetical protein ACRCSF_01970 [Mycobacteriaceae bacterium]
MTIERHFNTKYANGYLDISSVKDFVHQSHNHGFLLLKGLPLDGGLPHTPKNISTTPVSLPVIDSHLYNVGKAVGQIVAYAEEQHGRLLHDIRPVPGEEAKAENTGSTH